MKEIPLTKGYIALVDDDDYGWLMERKWCALISTNKQGRYVYAVSGCNPHLRMHRAILGAQHGELVDHIDGNTLNNQRLNLRKCTQAQNLRNAKKSRLNTTGFKGVTVYRGKFQARIWGGGIRHFLGQFATALEAHEAYKKAALQYHGAFARFE